MEPCAASNVKNKEMEAYTETCSSDRVTKQLSIHVQLDYRKAATRMQPLAITPCENGTACS